MPAARWSNHNCESWPELDLTLDEETLAFQAEVREFLAANREHIPTKSYDNAEGFAQHRVWDKVLFDAGLSVINWPEKYGGRDAPLLHWVVFEEEYFRAGAPGRASANGTSMLGPTLFAHGTEEQLDRILQNKDQESLQRMIADTKMEIRALAAELSRLETAEQNNRALVLGKAALSDVLEGIRNQGDRLLDLEGKNVLDLLS